MGHPTHFGRGTILTGWLHLAKCREQSTAVFFSESTIKAKKTCHLCPVRDPCLAEGMREEYGVWGGFTAPERAAYERELNHYVKTKLLPLYPDGRWVESGQEVGTLVAGSGGDETLEE